MELPADLKDRAIELWNEACWENDPSIVLARALMAERLSATERAAKIAESSGSIRVMGHDIAAAIRSQP